MRRLLAPGPVRCRAVAAVAVVAVVAGLGFTAGAKGRAPQAREAYGALRLKSVASQIAQVGGRYILALGDSHIERLYLPELCGLPVVNAGIAGATAADVAAFAERGAFDPRPAAILLTVGTNDAQVRRAPDTEDAAAAFRDDAQKLVWTLRRLSPHLLVTAVPPVAESGRKDISPPAARRFSRLLDRACGKDACIFLDLYALPTAPEPAMVADGVHLSNYRAAFTASERGICQALDMREASLGPGPRLSP